MGAPSEKLSFNAPVFIPAVGASPADFSASWHPGGGTQIGNPGDGSQMGRPGNDNQMCHLRPGGQMGVSGGPPMQFAGSAFPMAPGLVNSMALDAEPPGFLALWGLEDSYSAEEVKEQLHFSDSNQRKCWGLRLVPSVSASSISLVRSRWRLVSRVCSNQTLS